MKTLAQLILEMQTHSVDKLTERRKTPLSGQAQEEWGEVKRAIKQGDIPSGFTRKNFQRGLVAASAQPHNTIDWSRVQNTDAGTPGLNQDKIRKLYLQYKSGKKLNPAVLSKDPSIIAVHGNPNHQETTLLAGNTRAMLRRKVKKIRVGGKRYQVPRPSGLSDCEDCHEPVVKMDESDVNEAAKTTGEYRKDALAREAEFRRSVAPRQRELERQKGKPLQTRKRTLAQMAAGVEARTKMQDHYKAITPMHWKPPGMEDFAGAYTEVAGLHDPWLRPTSESSKPTDLFFSHGGDHLAIHSTVNAGHPTGDRMHSDLPDYRREGKEPVLQGRIGHKGVDKDGKPRGVITHLSLQTRASGFGERFIKAQKRRTANKLARMYPGYTHHDADDNMKEF